jgi:hypothetical protein
MRPAIPERKKREKAMAKNDLRPNFIQILQIEKKKCKKTLINWDWRTINLFSV